MKEKEKTRLFKMLAGRIVGQWHHHTKKESYTFSLCTAPDERTPVKIQKGNDRYNGYYTLTVDPQSGLFLVIEGLLMPFMANVAVLTHSILILQGANRELLIFQRRPDISFANRLIEAL